MGCGTRWLAAACPASTAASPLCSRSCRQPLQTQLPRVVVASRLRLRSRVPLRQQLRTLLSRHRWAGSCCQDVMITWIDSGIPDHSTSISIAHARDADAASSRIADEACAASRLHTVQSVLVMTHARSLRGDFVDPDPFKWASRPQLGAAQHR